MNHLIHSCLLALILYLVYRMFIKGSHGFQVHRFYILSIPIIAAILPLFVLPVDFEFDPSSVAQSSTVVQMPILLTSETQGQSLPTSQAVDAGTIILGTYAVGVLIALLLFFHKLAQIRQWNDNGTTTYKDGYYITLVDGLPSAFSFLNRIYINKNIHAQIADGTSGSNNSDYHQILSHEKVHVQQKHSWDLLFYEVLRILFWFHPVAYLAQRDLKLVHEFIADEKTIAEYGRKSYYQNLLKQVLDCPDYSFANPFFKLQTFKTRLTMIQSTTTTGFPYRKLLWILPVLFASLTYTACTTEPEIDLDRSIDPKMSEFTDSGPYSDVTDEEFALLQKIKNYEYTLLFKDKVEMLDMNLTLLEEARYEYEGRVKDALNEVKTEKIKDGMKIIFEYDDDKLYQAILKSRAIIDLPEDELAVIIAKTKIKEIVEEVEVEAVSYNDNDETDEVLKQTADVPFAIIENVPVYPGCTGKDNVELKSCMQEKITQYVQNNFDTSIAVKEGLKGKQTISVQFKVDTNGNVVDIKTRAKSASLQAEAERVVSSLPTMEPGMQRGKPVGVIYGLPIIFEVTE